MKNGVGTKVYLSGYLIIKKTKVLWMTMSGCEEKSDATKIVYRLKRRAELDCTWL